MCPTAKLAGFLPVVSDKMKPVYNAPVELFFRIDAQYKAQVVAQNLSKSLA
jgi:hypothetical protein